MKVTVLLEHAPGDEYWSAHVPAMPEGCVSDGKTPEEAADNVRAVITDFLQDDPALLENLLSAPEYLLTQVELPNAKP